MYINNIYINKYTHTIYTYIIYHISIYPPLKQIAKAPPGSLEIPNLETTNFYLLSLDFRELYI